MSGSERAFKPFDDFGVDDMDPQRRSHDGCCAGSGTSTTSRRRDPAHRMGALKCL